VPQYSGEFLTVLVLVLLQPEISSGVRQCVKVLAVEAQGLFIGVCPGARLLLQLTQRLQGVKASQLYASQFCSEQVYHLIELFFFLVQIILLSYFHAEAQVTFPHLVKSPAKPVQGAGEPVEEKGTMYSKEADKGDGGGPNS